MKKKEKEVMIERKQCDNNRKEIVERKGIRKEKKQKGNYS